ncbi:SDR family NAD(P)-dependent oxidoreductase [Streptomyces sp. YU58]|uniref:SDR family NAD(P)-dependent oxidoreductase n=1 Tax=Streptomyces sp. SX92 TaxID=3158972 RepID=UPI0027B946AC|nr:SDR family NAD(P)-dependent oxidoreductase [Streptomyces coralus]WLW54348.1 SDR family NAD(P)-dependent oxidoreductase [Streptomyces coralus]
MSLPPPSPQATALITGASSGIGAALAQALAARGYGTTLVARDKAQLRHVAEGLQKYGGRVDVIEADLTDRADRQNIEEQIKRAGLAVDILVNSAGAATRARIPECDLDTEFAHMELNVVSVVDLCRRFVNDMVDRGSGAILNVASTAAFRPLPGQGTYAASKAFVVAFTRTLRLELQDSPVTVTTLCPGPVATDFARRAGFSDEDITAIPSIMWESAEDVAAMAVDAMDRGAEFCIPGRANVADVSLSLLNTKQQASQAVSRKAAVGPSGSGTPGRSDEVPGL